MRTDEELKILFAQFDKDMATKTKLYRFWLAVDQLGNVIFMNGSQNETISSHISRRQEAGTATRLNNFVCCLLKKLERNHCKKSEGE
ncbi:MAG: hypothetical protein AB7D29_07690 [Campylobacterales bacterium]